MSKDLDNTTQLLLGKDDESKLIGSILINDTVYMTGEEWYKKFEQEQKNMIITYTNSMKPAEAIQIAVDEFKLAAKRASGAKDE